MFMTTVIDIKSVWIIRYDFVSKEWWSL